MADLQAANWDLALLRNNPFLLTPAQRPEEAIWAGFPNVKAQFDNLLRQALNSSRTQVVLNWGEYGSGKTHAATYFGIPSHFPPTQGRKVNDIWIIRMQTPQEPERAQTLLYQRVIESVRFRRLRDVMRGILASLGEDVALERLEEIADSEVFGRALWLLGGDSDTVDNQRALETYFYGQARLC